MTAHGTGAQNDAAQDDASPETGHPDVPDRTDEPSPPEQPRGDALPARLQRPDEDDHPEGSTWTAGSVSVLGERRSWLPLALATSFVALMFVLLIVSWAFR